jgi:hypothetical protein
MAKVKIIKNERDPPLFTNKQLIKFEKILRNTTQVIVRHRICLQTDGHGETSIPPYNFVAGGIIKCDKRQMTSCVHKMCGRRYGQTNMKRAITLAKINHLCNRYNMHMLRSWPIKIPNMNKMRQKTND